MAIFGVLFLDSLFLISINFFKLNISKSVIIYIKKSFLSLKILSFNSFFVGQTFSIAFHRSSPVASDRSMTPSYYGSSFGKLSRMRTFLRHRYKLVILDFHSSPAIRRIAAYIAN